MEPAYSSAFFGLLGATIGGLTSVATAWMTQLAARRDINRQAEQSKREALYGDFIAEASRLYGDALSHEKDDVTSLVQLYAIVAKMRLFTSRKIVVAAEDVMRAITETYLAPDRRTLRELHAFAQGGGMDFLLAFGEACRKDLSLASDAPTTPPRAR
jgi:hypothetical protein